MKPSSRRLGGGSAGSERRFYHGDAWGGHGIGRGGWQVRDGANIHAGKGQVSNASRISPAPICAAPPAALLCRIHAAARRARWRAATAATNQPLTSIPVHNKARRGARRLPTAAAAVISSGPARKHLNHLPLPVPPHRCAHPHPPVAVLCVDVGAQAKPQSWLLWRGKADGRGLQAPPAARPHCGAHRGA